MIGITVFLYFDVLIFTVFGQFHDTTNEKQTVQIQRTKADRQQCAGWGFAVRSRQEYKKKNSCLVIGFHRLCCIDVPNCPPDLVPEVPIKPYRIYSLKMLKIGCMEKSQVQDHLTISECPIEFSKEVKKKKKKLCFIL